MAETIEIKVEGMSCGHCKMRVEKAALSIPGVTAAAADLREGKLEVHYTGNDSVESVTERLRKAVRDVGYRA